jgi:PUA-domain protein
MTQKQQRYSLKSKKAKQLLNKLSEILNFDVKTYFDPKINIEIAKSSLGNIYLVNDKPLFFEIKNRVFPTLMFQEFILQAPTIVVDMGAIPYVCNGADVMAPGIVQVKGDFEKGGLVLIIDEKHGKPIALGESLYDSKTVRSAKKGAVIRNIHFVSDKIWNFAKALTS